MFWSGNSPDAGPGGDGDLVVGKREGEFAARLNPNRVATLRRWYETPFWIASHWNHQRHTIFDELLTEMRPLP